MMATLTPIPYTIKLLFKPTAHVFITILNCIVVVLLLDLYIQVKKRSNVEPFN